MAPSYSRNTKNSKKTAPISAEEKHKILEEEFAKSPYCRGERNLELCAMFNMTRRRLDAWFYNRRINAGIATGTPGLSHSTEVLKILENAFKTHQYVTRELTKELTEKVGLNEKQIWFWYRKRRAKAEAAHKTGAELPFQMKLLEIAYAEDPGLTQETINRLKEEGGLESKDISAYFSAQNERAKFSKHKDAEKNEQEYLAQKKIKDWEKFERHSESAVKLFKETFSKFQFPNESLIAELIEKTQIEAVKIRRWFTRARETAMKAYKNNGTPLPLEMEERQKEMETIGNATKRRRTSSGADADLSTTSSRSKKDKKNKQTEQREPKEEPRSPSIENNQPHCSTSDPSAESNLNRYCNEGARDAKLRKRPRTLPELSTFCKPVVRTRVSTDEVKQEPIDDSLQDHGDQASRDWRSWTHSQVMEWMNQIIPRSAQTSFREEQIDGSSMAGFLNQTIGGLCRIRARNPRLTTEHFKALGEQMKFLERRWQ